MIIEIITRYEKEDEDCDGDYCAVDILVNGNVIIDFGDHYHDTGTEKAEAWVRGYITGLMSFGCTTPKVINKSVNDYE